LADIHDLDDTVVAIIDDPDRARRAVSELRRANYEVEVLQGEEGKQHLDPAGESGPMAAIKRLLNVFGDQYRILERLTAELERGNHVISVDSEPDEATEAVRILQDHDGEFIWKLGTWTYSRIGD
jgi:DNA-binding NarL/FixJ family response regulator